MAIISKNTAFSPPKCTIARLVWPMSGTLWGGLMGKIEWARELSPTTLKNVSVRGKFSSGVYSCRIKPSRSRSVYIHRSLLSMWSALRGNLMDICDRAREHWQGTPEIRFLCQSVSLAKIGVRLVTQTLQSEIGSYETFIWTYWWVIVTTFDGNLGLWVPYP